METSTELHQAFENYLSGTPSEQDLLLIQAHFKQDATSEQLMQLIRRELESDLHVQNSDAIESVVNRTDGFIRNCVEEKAK